MTRWLLALFIILIGGSAFAGRGGHVTTWDPNLFPGKTIVCFNGSVAGCSQTLNAPCNGGASPDAAAWTAFTNIASPKVLYIAPGSRCDGVFGIWQGDIDFWMYGATIGFMNQMGGFGYFDADFSCATKCALIQTVSAGACTLPLITSGDVTRFAVGKWIQVGDTGMGRNADNPMTVLHSEAVLITAIAAPNITISPCLKNGYSQTLPVIGDAFQGGPATIWLLQDSWDTNVRYHGGTILDGQSVIQGRSIQLVDLVFNFPPGRQNTPAPSSPGNIFISFSYLPSMEIDKNIGLLNVDRSRARNIFIQSAGDNVQFSSTPIGSLVGTTTNLTLINSPVGSAFIGPTNGPGGNLTLDNSPIASLVCSNTAVDTSLLTFSAGTFSIPKGSAAAANVYATFVPNNTYYFGETDGTNDSVPHTQFDVAGLRQDSTNTYIDIKNCSWGSCSGALPTPTCNGHGCFRYVAYQVMALSQKFSNAPGIGACVAP